MNEFKPAAQLKIEQSEMKKIIDQLAERMKLRQWCVEKAVATGCTDTDSLKAIAEMFYDFITTTHNID